jgi:hypothetical protein
MPNCWALDLAGLKLASTCVLVGILSPCLSLSAVAAPLPWFATSVRGVVVYLQGDRWELVTRGQPVATTATVRTLENGRLTLSTGGSSIELEPNSAMLIDTSFDTSHTSIQQWDGVVTVTAGSGGASPQVTLQVGKLTVTAVTGALRVGMTAVQTTFQVLRGNVMVRGANGDVLAIPTGNFVVDMMSSMPVKNGTPTVTGVTGASVESKGLGGAPGLDRGTGTTPGSNGNSNNGDGGANSGNNGRQGNGGEHGNAVGNGTANSANKQPR